MCYFCEKRYKISRLNYKASLISVYFMSKYRVDELPHFRFFPMHAERCTARFYDHLSATTFFYLFAQRSAETEPLGQKRAKIKKEQSGWKCRMDKTCTCMLAKDARFKNGFEVKTLDRKHVCNVHIEVVQNHLWHGLGESFCLKQQTTEWLFEEVSILRIHPTFKKEPL